MKKFLSLILALTLVASLFTVNVMAASKAHTVTISVDPAAELKAGDVITVELTVDNTEGIASMEYVLTYDEDAFTADTSLTEDDVEAYIDIDWLDDITNRKSDFYKGGMKAPTYNVSDGIKFSWAGDVGVPAENAENDRVIGLFYLTVNEDVTDGEYTFAFTGTTSDSGVGVGTADITATPVTVTVGSGAPVVPDEPEVTVPEAAADALTGGVAGNAGENYDNAAMTTATFTNIADIVKVGVLFMPTELLDGELNFDTPNKANAEYAGELSALGEGSYTLKAALRGIPRKYHAGIGITSRAYAIYGDNAVKYADAKAGTITFAATAE